jgi:hypothetical protein
MVDSVEHETEADTTAVNNKRRRTRSIYVKTYSLYI